PAGWVTRGFWSGCDVDYREAGGMTFENLVVEERERWLEVTIQRPKALNALDRRTMEELAAVTQQLQDAADLRGMILTGAGEKAFVAGADRGARGALDTQQAPPVAA